MPGQSVQAILLDIEGTTTPVDFVYEVLFPFARRHVREFIAQHHDSPEIAGIISAFATEHHAELNNSPDRMEAARSVPPWNKNSTDSLLESATRYVYWLMDQDRKSTALKALQGQIWKEGYLIGQLQSQIYPDVLPAFKRWKEQRRDIHIFSSGSILAQKLLFAHTTEGDLTRYVSEYFDTTTGAKTDASSYRAIGEKIGVPGAEVLFVSDVNAELDAANRAGMQTALCVRQEPSATENLTHQLVHTFDVIFP